MSLSRSELTKKLLEAKKDADITFELMADSMNVNKVWLVSAILGEHPMGSELAEKMMDLLCILEDPIRDTYVECLARIPERRGASRASDDGEDPIIRRFHELIDVYGSSWKALIQEEFGDGIMSAIDCSLKLEEKVTKEGQRRVIITIDGKFLPYNANQ